MKIEIDIPKKWIDEMDKENYPSIHQYMKICHAIKNGIVLQGEKNNEANRIIDSFDRITSGIKQESILDKIRENIQFIKDKCLSNTIAEEYEQKGLQEALDIIDKYKAESEKE